MSTQALPSTLATELATYAAHKDALLSICAGRWVLIKDSQVVASFDTQNDAVEAGYRQFGNVPFLTKQVLVIESPARFSRDLWATSQ